MHNMGIKHLDGFNIFSRPLHQLVFVESKIQTYDWIMIPYVYHEVTLESGIERWKQ